MTLSHSYNKRKVNPDMMMNKKRKENNTYECAEALIFVADEYKRLKSSGPGGFPYFCRLLYNAVFIDVYQFVGTAKYFHSFCVIQ